MSQLFLSTVEAVSGHEYKSSYLMSIFLLSVECQSSFPVKHMTHLTSACACFLLRKCHFRFRTKEFTDVKIHFQEESVKKTNLMFPYRVAE